MLWETCRAVNSLLGIYIGCIHRISVTVCVLVCLNVKSQVIRHRYLVEINIR